MPRITFYVAKDTYFLTFVQVKTFPLVIVLFIVEILFILYARKFRLCFAIGKKLEALIYYFLPVSTLRSALAIRTARIIIKRWKLAQHFQEICWLRERRHVEIVVERPFVNSSISIVT